MGVADPRVVDELEALTARLQAVGFCLPGSLNERYTHCNWPGCRCMADPPERHGPYWSWTRKVQGTTVTRVLSAEQVADYGDWFDHHRQLRALVRDIETLSVGVVESDPRFPPRRSRRRG